MDDAYNFLGLPQSQWRFHQYLCRLGIRSGHHRRGFVFALARAKCNTTKGANFTANVMLVVGNGEISPIS